MSRMRTHTLLIFLLALVPQRSLGNEFLWEQLHGLYPFLTQGEVREKVRVARSPFEFFRSFVALYYDVIVTRPELTHSFRDVRKEKGWCVGDAHPENFGILLNRKAKAVFTVNDWDDTGACPVYADVIRFLTAATIYNSGLDLSALRASYLRTLAGGEPKLSRPTESLMARSERGGYIISKSELTPQGFLIRPDQAIELTDAERTTLTSTLTAVGIFVKDAYRVQRRQGGSFGSWRIRVLAQLTGRQALIELKELLPSGLHPITSTDPQVFVRDRINKMLSLLFGNDVPHGVAVVPYDGKYFLMRPRWQTNVSVDLEKFSKKLSSKDLFSILRDQAEVLGALHRRTVENPERYLAAMTAVEADAWIATAHGLAEELIAIQKDLLP